MSVRGGGEIVSAAASGCWTSESAAAQSPASALSLFAVRSPSVSRRSGRVVRDARRRPHRVDRTAQQIGATATPWSVRQRRSVVQSTDDERERRERIATHLSAHPPFVSLRLVISVWPLPPLSLAAAVATVTSAESTSAGAGASPSSLPVSLSLCVADRIRDHEPHYSAAPPPAGPSADAHRGVQSLCGGRLLSLLVSQSQVEQSRQADGGAALSDAMLLAGSGSGADQRSGAGHDPDAQRSQEMLQAGLDATAVRANQTTTAAVDAWLVQQMQGATPTRA